MIGHHGIGALCPGCPLCRPASPETRERERAAAEARVRAKRRLRVILRALGLAGVEVR